MTINGRQMTTIGCATQKQMNIAATTQSRALITSRDCIQSIQIHSISSNSNPIQSIQSSLLQVAPLVDLHYHYHYQVVLNAFLVVLLVVVLAALLVVPENLHK